MPPACSLARQRSTLLNTHYEARAEHGTWPFFNYPKRVSAPPPPNLKRPRGGKKRRNTFLKSGFAVQGAAADVHGFLPWCHEGTIPGRRFVGASSSRLKKTKQNNNNEAGLFNSICFFAPGPLLHSAPRSTMLMPLNVLWCGCMRCPLELAWRDNRRSGTVL